MKKIMMILFIVTIATVNVKAQEEVQPKKTAEERATAMTKRMTKELALNAEQQTKVKAITLKREQERDALHEKLKNQQNETDAELKTVLSPEQFEKLKKKGKNSN